MEDLFDPATAGQFRLRIQSVNATSQRQWGKMSAAQMMEHCARGIETATGECTPPRILMSLLLGPFIKPLALKEGATMRHDTPTAPMLVVSDDLDLETARTRLLKKFDGFVQGGAPHCTRYPHAFFGKLTADQWSKLMYKHLDHHLRQFSA